LGQKITFRGTVVDGRGTFVQLHVPGRSEIPHAPPDWPDLLEKGSLNILVDDDGYPPQFAVYNLPLTVKSLDNRCFPAIFEIAQSAFGNNQLAPSREMPHRGSAQVWRAKLFGCTSLINCWVLRRYGSGLSRELELVSECHLRKMYGLSNGARVSVELELVKGLT